MLLLGSGLGPIITVEIKENSCSTTLLVKICLVIDTRCSVKTLLGRL